MKYIGFDVAFRAMSIDAAMALNISSVFSLSAAASVNAKALMFDAVLATDFEEHITLASGHQYAKRKGNGIRIAMCMTDVKAEVKFSFSCVAAQTKLGFADTRYKVEGVGLNTATIARLFDVPISGSLDEESFTALRKAISEDLPDYLEKADLAPAEFAVPLPVTTSDPASRARAIMYAATMVARKEGLQDALHQRPVGVSSEMIVVQYAQLAQIAESNKNDMPTTAAADRANRWLQHGVLE